MNQIVVNETKSIIADLANRYGMEKAHFEKVMMATVMPSKVEVSREQFVAFLSVAKEYDLNPWTKEIYAFPAKTGGIQPIVSIDGWMRIINGHKQFDGMVFKDIKDDKGRVTAIEAIIYRKDRQHPVTVTEYLEECKRNTEPWNKWPIRMLRHKATIQCARYAFGFSGIYDQDEVERLVDVTPPTPKQNIELSNHFMGSGSSEKIEHKPQLDTLLKQANRQQPEPVVKQSLTPEPTVSERETVEPPLPLEEKPRPVFIRINSDSVSYPNSIDHQRLVDVLREMLPAEIQGFKEDNAGAFPLLKQHMDGNQWNEFNKLIGV